MPQAPQAGQLPSSSCLRQNCQTKCTEIQRESIGVFKIQSEFKVEVDKKEVYNGTEKLKFLLNAVEGSAKSCLSKFTPGSDKYIRKHGLHLTNVLVLWTTLCQQLKSAWRNSRS